MTAPFLGYENILPLLSPQDIASTATTTAYMDLRNAQQAGFLVAVGASTTGTSTDAEVITVVAATAEGGTEAAIAFRYRQSGVAGANTWGAVTTADTTGVTLASTDDDVWTYIEVDPDALAGNDYRYARVVLTDTPDMAAFLTCVFGVINPRYKQTTHISATASASA
jgi:hypothetical protein